MEEVSLSNRPVTGMNDVAEKNEQNGKYKILNPQNLEQALYNCFDKICDNSDCNDYCDI